MGLPQRLELLVDRGTGERTRRAYGADIGEDCMIGAGALIPEGKQIPARSVVLGSPGKVIRQVSEQDLERMRWGVETYVDRWKAYVRGLQPQAPA